MKKYSKFLIILMALVMLIQTGCFKKSIDIDDVDWKKKIEEDFLSDDSIIGEAIADAVSLRVEMEDDVVTVIVKAPDIYDDLVDWIENVKNGQFSEKALEEKMTELIDSAEPVKTTHTLDYEIEDDRIVVTYDWEFENAINCGLEEFYDELEDKEKDGTWVVLDDDADERRTETEALIERETEDDSSGKDALNDLLDNFNQPETMVERQVDAVAEETTIEVRWDGTSGTGELIDLDIILECSMDDGGFARLGMGTSEAYVNDTLVAQMFDYSTEDEHVVEILIYDTEGLYTFYAAPKMNADGYIVNGEVMSSEIEATVCWDGGKSKTFDLDHGLYRGNTGVWVWMPFEIYDDEVIKLEGDE